MSLRNNVSENYESAIPTEVSLKKRVLVFVPEFPKLTETFIQREISKLIELGNLEITVFSLKKSSGKLLEGVSDHVVYQRLGVLSFLKGWVYFLTTRPSQLWNTAKYFFSLKKGNSFSKVPFFFKSVGYTYLFSLQNPDHIHANFMSWPSTMAMIASLLLEIPYSISAHAKDVMVEGEYFAPKVETAKFISICNRLAYEDCINRSGKDSGKDNPSNVLLQYHGIDSVKAFESISPAKRGERLFLFNGGARLVEKKGQKYLLEAAKILKDKGLDFELHIAGPGPLYSDLMLQIAELGLENNVFIHGKGNGVPFDEVVAYLKACDIVVQSNINLNSGDADGIPTFVIEAAMLGKPIVATDAGSITELIINGETGWVVPQRDPQALADAILQVLQGQSFIQNEVLPLVAGETPSWMKDCPLEVQKKALDMFDLDKNIKELEQLLLK